VVSSLVYYAMGGGLGHVVRASAFVHSVGLTARVTLITASEFALDSRIAAGFDLAVAPSELDRQPDEFRSWLLALIESVGADCLCLDTFPAGILGELDARQVCGLELWHVARRLSWQNYATLLPAVPVRFDRCWRVEPLHPEQEAFLERQCDEVIPLDLGDPPAQSVTPPIAPPYWLVVHSGPESEVADLVAHASEMRAIEQIEVPIYVVTQCQLTFGQTNIRMLEAFPATPYFEGASRIITAAGFNVVRQTSRYRHKQTIVPMRRRYDDQYERARRARHEQ
jgi:hypothetical protein